MDYGMIGKIEKAKRYAEERERFRFDKFSVTFSGENNAHKVSFENGVFHCDCEFFMMRHRCSHMNPCRVQERNGVVDSPQKQWEFSSAQDYTVDGIMFPESIQNAAQSVACFIRERSQEELGNVLRVHVCLIIAAGHDDRQPPGTERRLIEPALHREPSADQAEAPKPPLRRDIAGRRYDADEGNRGSPGHFVEDDVRSAGGEQRQLRARAGQGFNAEEEVFDQFLLVVGPGQSQQPIDINTVDQNRWRALDPALARDGHDQAIVINCGLRADAPDHADSPHQSSPSRSSLSGQSYQRAK